MGNLMVFLHNAVITQGIFNRHMIHTGERKGLPSRLEDEIVHVLSRETCTSPEVYVHWGVYESGKSRAARNAAIRLQGGGIGAKLVMLSHGWDFTHKTKLRDWLRISIGIPDDRAEDKLSLFLPHKNETVMILDHPESLIKQYGANEMVDGLRELGIPVLIMVTSWERAVELKRAGCVLVGEPGFGRWTEDELNDLYQSFPESVREKCKPIRLELAGTSVMSGSPGVLFHECHHGQKASTNMLRARLMQNEWINGMRALQGQDMGEITGRFPDKQGTFHWDAL
jgi:hypothetical protein